MRFVYSETSSFGFLRNEIDLNKLRKTPVPHFPFRNSFFVWNALTEEEEKKKKQQQKKKAKCVCTLT
jgi:hypothetical protein